MKRRKSSKTNKLADEITVAIDRYYKRHPRLRVSAVLGALHTVRRTVERLERMGSR